MYDESRLFNIETVLTGDISSPVVKEDTIVIAIYSPTSSLSITMVMFSGLVGSSHCRNTRSVA